jgi:hypothetical protein
MGESLELATLLFVNPRRRVLAVSTNKWDDPSFVLSHCPFVSFAPIQRSQASSNLGIAAIAFKKLRNREKVDSDLFGPSVTSSSPDR